MSDRRAEERPPLATSDLAPAAMVLARRFAAGATLWCWAPGADSHARHLAVEFVHPVIVGTRALPAVAVVADPTEALRVLARPGDVLLVVATEDAAALVHGTLRRAPAWGVTTIWMGVGPRPATSAADHLLWLSDDLLARHDGRLVLGYHLLWELTHVCFEHPGLLEEAADDIGACITCADEGRLGEVVRPDVEAATVRTARGIETVSTALVGELGPGDLVLVHAGTAITRLDP